MVKKEVKTCGDCFWIHQFSLGNKEYRCELPVNKKKLTKRYIVKMDSKICRFFRLKK